MHAMVDVDTREILAVRVTDDRMRDLSMFIPLLDDTLGNRVRPELASESGRVDDPARHSMYGDATYASRDNLKACRDSNVTPLIKLKVSSTPKGKGAGDVWGMAVRNQFGGSDPNRVKWLSGEEKKGNQDEWKTRVGYGKRWIVEIVFSAFKRMFGEHLYSLKMEEHDPGGQSQCVRLQQADRHGSRGNVESDRRIQYKSWVTGLNYATR